MNLQADDFELFGLTRQFAQDRTVLEERWKRLQREAHPDKFAADIPVSSRARTIQIPWISQ